MQGTHSNQGLWQITLDKIVETIGIRIRNYVDSLLRVPKFAPFLQVFKRLAMTTILTCRPLEKSNHALLLPFQLRPTSNDVAHRMRIRMPQIRTNQPAVAVV